MTLRFSHRTTLSVRKPVSFWQEKCDTVVILLQGFPKNSRRSESLCLRLEFSINPLNVLQSSLSVFLFSPIKVLLIF